MSLSLNYIERIREEKTLTSSMSNILEILLNSINDWPNSIENLNHFEIEIHNLIQGEVNKKNLTLYLKNVDFAKNAWHAESLSQLIEIYNYYEENRTLEQIIQDIELKL